MTKIYLRKYNYLELILINNIYTKGIRNALFITLLLLSSWVGAQETFQLSGVVRSASGETLPLVQIKIDSVVVATTDMDGSYHAETTKGLHSINIFYIGFASFNKKIKVDKDQTYDIILKPTTLTLSETTIEVDRAAIKEAQGYAVNSIETEEFRSQSVELNDMLSQTAGIAVRQEGGLGSRTQYSLNGLKGRAVKFFFDGVPMDYFGSSFSVNTIPVSLIDRIDVYKGVVPAELGTDALGGAVNLVSHKTQKNGGEFSYSFGSFNTHRLSGFGHWRDSTSGFTTQLFAFYNHSDNDYEVWGDDIYVTNLETFAVERGIKAKRFNDAFTSKSIKANIGFTDKKWADQLYLGLLWSDMDKEIQHGPTMERPFGEAFYTQKVWIPHLVYQKYDVLKGLDLNLFTSYSILERARVDTSVNIYNWYGDIEGTRTLGGEQTRTLNVIEENAFVSRVNLVYHINDKHSLVLNDVYQNVVRDQDDELITFKNDGYWAPQTMRKNVLSVSYKAELFAHKLKYAVFAKNFHYKADVQISEYEDGKEFFYTSSQTHTSNGIGVAASYQLLPNLLVQASGEKTTRLPDTDELLGDGLNVLYTDSLRPERSNNLNAGFRLELLKEKKDRITINTNIFYRDVTDLIQQYQYSDGAFVNINFDKVRMTGVDFSINYNLRKWLKLSASYSYLNPLMKSERTETGEVNESYNEPLPNTPMVMPNASARLHFDDIFQKKDVIFFYYNIHYVGEFYRYSARYGEFDKDMIPTQIINNCGIGYQFPKQKLSLSVDFKNIFDEQAFDNYAVQKPGRSAFVKVVNML